MESFDESFDQVNNGVSLLRAISAAVVQRPEKWQVILNRARDQIRVSHSASLAFELIEHELRLVSAVSRRELQRIGQELASPDSLKRLGPELSPRELAGRSLLAALDEIPEPGR